MKNTHSFYLLFVIFCLGCSETDFKTNHNIKKANTESLFENPNLLVEKLSENGIGKLSKWDNPFNVGWGSLTPYYLFGNVKDGFGVSNNVAYYLDGSENFCSKITIVLNINNSDERKEGLRFLSDLTEKTLKTIGLSYDNELKNNLVSGKVYSFKGKGFDIKVEKENSKIETFKVIIGKL
jgi:hypothetical protein